MRYMSQIFQPILTIPKNAKIKNTEITCKSQKLLMECGLVRPTSSGLSALLPLGRRVVDKIEGLVREAIEGVGGQRISLPNLTSEGLWKKTGRLEGVGQELMKMVDRHGKKYLLAPTHEEAIADLLSDTGPISYKQLPLLLYQVGNKYRDEHRPKHGLLRAREFAMLDAYGAHAQLADAERTYCAVSAAYAALFRRLQLPVHTVPAPPGDMGGSLSHEWQVPASAGEDSVAVCPSCSHVALPAACERDRCDKCGGRTRTVNTIEVGHTFILGTRYSEPLGAHYVPPTGPPQPLLMSCYGIGITRLMSASVEALSTDTSLRWPAAIAPYKAIIITPKEGSQEWSCCWERAQRLQEQLSALPGYREDVLLDDRHHLTIGKRLLMADRMGFPLVIVCGRSALDTSPRLELFRTQPHHPESPSPRLVSTEELLSILQDPGYECNKERAEM